MRTNYVASHGQDSNLRLLKFLPGNIFLLHLAWLHRSAGG